MTRHQSNGHRKVRSLILRVKCDYSVQRLGTNTNKANQKQTVSNFPLNLI